jgi:dihydrofolate reductase
VRKVIVSNYISLDGFFAGPNGEYDWFVWDEETAEYVKEMLRSIDTLLFGRVTYELMAGYWPTASPPTEDPVIIDAMNNLPKIVFSRALEKVEWNNSRLVKDNIVQEVARLKERPGKDMVIFGSGSIVSAFTQSGLIDDYRVFINPVVLGSGKVLFKGLKERLKLKLINTKTFQCGVVLLHYGLETK